MSAPSSPDGPLERLARRTEDLCAGAVDTLEIAAGLEADGINDETAARYGYPDVFALAEDLYARTERRPQAAAAPPNPWRAEAWRHLLRGLLFGLPGLAYATTIPAATAPGAGAVLVLSLLLSWPVSQGSAYLAYIRIGRRDWPAAARVLRRGLLSAGLLLVPVIALAGFLLDAGGAATALAVAQCVYLLAATVALVGGAELWLLAALLPGATVSTAQLLTTGDDAGAAGWTGWTITIAATVGLAAVRTATPGEPRGRVLSYRDVVAALPHALFGLLAGGLLTIATMATPLNGTPAAHATTAAVLALSLSMGVAEWILVHYRRVVYRLLLGSGSVRGFTRAARAALAAVVTGYMLALTTLAVAIMWAAGVPVAAATPWVAGGYICLGGAFFVGLLLQSCGRIPAALVACGVALAAEVAVVVAADPGPARLAGRFAITAALFGALSIFAFVVLGRATSHR
jgi:hypothetical protein